MTAPGELGELAATLDDMADRLEAAGRRRRNVMADVAHELRTPLAVLQGDTEAMLDGIVAPDETALTSLHREVTRLTRLVGDLETLAAADAARLTMHPWPLDLAVVAERATAWCAPPHPRPVWRLRCTAMLPGCRGIPTSCTRWCSTC
ncbi:histidine kinase dimerization/phospho-acceptor domain-containing protein [Euzebya sp.]|uniref:histidine kinase dimerization/phospho-acceptor domain-containing protein n=1 Tax=Euzebya sp. TaxID=1971409 RepID=UPI003513245C